MLCAVNFLPKVLLFHMLSFRWTAKVIIALLSSYLKVYPFESSGCDSFFARPVSLAMEAIARRKTDLL